MRFWSRLLTGVVGVVIGFVASYPVGYLRERGRQRAVRADQARASKQRREAAANAAATQALAREQEECKRREHIETLKKERIGRRFLRRSNSKEEAGVIVTVIDLDRRDPKRRVLVENTPGGAELPADVPTRLVMDWHVLVAAPEVQKHRTARLIAHSSDDADGWLEFEQLPPGDD
jgi:hypothetical protein